MLVRSLISVALAAGFTLAVPVADNQGGLHRRDNHIIQARSNGHSHNLRIRQITNADGVVVWITEISYLTVVVDEDGIPLTTQSGVRTIFPETTEASSQIPAVTSVTARTTLVAPIVSTSKAPSATPSSVSVDDGAAAIEISSAATPKITNVPSSPLVSSTFVSSTLSSVVKSSTPSSSSKSSTPTSSVVESTTSISSSSVTKPSLISVSSSSATSSSTAVESAAATSSTPNNGLHVPEIITYSPYNDDNTCKDVNAVRKDLSAIAAKGIKSVRIYGTDCNSIYTVEPTARDLGLKIDQGFWIGPSGASSIDSGVQELIDWVRNKNGNDWSLFTIFTVGNEAVYANYVNAPTLLSKIKEVKAKLRAAGWTGPVTTAEPPSTYSNDPELCTASDGIDIVGINAHPYFNAAGSASDSGNFIKAQISFIQSICGSNVNIRITETGYPSAGNTNGNQVPSKENQIIALKQIMDVTNNKAVMFTMYDDYWKAPGPYNVEQHFGIFYLYD
ncbi:hypothetical protein D0Z00_004579 [Geotrichum galactomycetum]|uniref:Uncharacterized protein n=1 Tax=Geotrichum galactomycetum TaxID=27317 RepID=A0ACB6UY17_9ASCO|nr:hypothetical protein D0Z00_004579 [Geotrichum candidum]